MSQQEIIQLLDRYLAGTATITEQERVEAWLDSNEDLNNEWQNMDEAGRTKLLAELYQTIQSTIQLQPGVVSDRPQADGGQRGGSGTGPRVRQMWKWIAAASIIIIASLAVVGVFTNNHRATTTTTATTHDVPAPSNTRAVITLADGSKVYLDSTGNGVLAQQNNVTVTRNDKGEILYLSPSGGGARRAGEDRPGVDYNTLYNPRGSKAISLTLSDGTKVWLNSESSLRYPASFASSALNREVEITGEAFFEVKHNAKQPFKVHLPNGSIVEDIGTSFNINAYNDESDIKTTLIEGAVKVSSRPGALAVNLKPGEQASLNTFNLQLSTFNNVDLEATLAWKNGNFVFEGADIKTIMRQLSRWYDVDVQYDADIKSSFVAKISRDVPISQLLKIMELTDLVHFKIEGKKITVYK